MDDFAVLRWRTNETWRIASSSSQPRRSSWPGSVEARRHFHSQGRDFASGTARIGSRGIAGSALPGERLRGILSVLREDPREKISDVRQNRRSSLARAPSSSVSNRRWVSVNFTQPLHSLVSRGVASPQPRPSGLQSVNRWGLKTGEDRSAGVKISHGVTLVSSVYESCHNSRSHVQLFCSQYFARGETRDPVTESYPGADVRSVPRRPPKDQRLDLGSWNPDEEVAVYESQLSSQGRAVQIPDGRAQIHSQGASQATGGSTFVSLSVVSRVLPPVLGGKYSVQYPAGSLLVSGRNARRISATGSKTASFHTAKHFFSIQAFFVETEVPQEPEMSSKLSISRRRGSGTVPVLGGPEENYFASRRSARSPGSSWLQRSHRDARCQLSLRDRKSQFRLERLSPDTNGTRSSSSLNGFSLAGLHGPGTQSAKKMSRGCQRVASRMPRPPPRPGLTFRSTFPDAHTAVHQVARIRPRGARSRVTKVLPVTLPRLEESFRRETTADVSEAVARR